jgi:hypothetical protein
MKKIVTIFFTVMVLAGGISVLLRSKDEALY